MKNSGTKSWLTYVACVAMVLLLAPGVCMANPELADAKDCFSCHSVDEKSIGPAYKDIAAKFADQPDAVPILVNKVLKGSSGDWGRRRMPANKNVSEAEARQLVEWVLSLK